MTTARTMSFASDSAQEKLCTILAALESRDLEALELATTLGVSRRLIYLYLHHLLDTRRIRVARTLTRHARETAVYAPWDVVRPGVDQAEVVETQPWKGPTPEAVAAVRRRLLAQKATKQQMAHRGAFDQMLFGEARA